MTDRLLIAVAAAAASGGIGILALGVLLFVSEMFIEGLMVCLASAPMFLGVAVAMAANMQIKAQSARIAVLERRLAERGGVAGLPPT